MRITIEIEDDLDGLVRELALKRGASYKAVLNDALREALCGAGELTELMEPVSLGLQPGVDPRRLSELADELEVEERSGWGGLRVAESDGGYGQKS